MHTDFDFDVAPFGTQIPWGRWMVSGAPLVIELNDVSLEATPRNDQDWEEGPALARELATKQAELAAAEIAKLSRRSGWGRWTIIESLATYLLNNLQLSINNVHLKFRSPPTASHPAGIMVGLQFDQLSTATDVRSFSATMVRMVRSVQQVSMG